MSEEMATTVHGVTPVGNLVVQPADEASVVDVLHRLAAQFDAEASSYRRMVGNPAGRCTTAEAVSRCASIARQLAYQVERRGIENAARRLPPAAQPAPVSMEDAVRVALDAEFRTKAGRDPTSRERQDMVRDAQSMRAALVAAWPLLRIVTKAGLPG